MNSMIEIIRFSIPGEPKGKARPRVVRTSAGTRAYTPDKTVAYEELVRIRFSELHREPLEGEVAARITAYYAIPKSATKKRGALMECNQIRPMKKPDADNVSKIILDALNGLAYHDDSQVVELSISKRFATIPRVEVELWQIM